MSPKIDLGSIRHSQNEKSNESVSGRGFLGHNFHNFPDKFFQKGLLFLAKWQIEVCGTPADIVQSWISYFGRCEIIPITRAALTFEEIPKICGDLLRRSFGRLFERKQCQLEDQGYRNDDEETDHPQGKQSKRPNGGCGR
ncbi:MAG: hypothetical protein DI540_16070 [Sphingobium sp.]|nr:MAG: hypothetical protein DI540_16070 [Sphingobium sp.]